MHYLLKLVCYVIIYCSLLPFCFAIENLSTPCDELLSELSFDVDAHTHVRLTQNQILIRGRLEAYWEQGMEDQTGWAVFDDDHELKMFISPIDSLYFLKSGDQIFILDDNGEVTLSGYYGEQRIRETVTVMGKITEIAPNRPMLYHDAGLTLPALPTEEFMDYFGRGQRVVAVQTLEPQQIQALRAHLLPQIEAYQRHLENPERYVWAGERVVYELAYFERAFSGRIRWSPTQISHSHFTPTEEGYSTYFTHEPGARLYLESSKEGTVAIRYGERVLLFDKDENLLLQVVVETDQGVPIRQSGNVDLLDVISKTKKIIVIRTVKPETSPKL